MSGFHTHAAIVSIGDELVLGQNLDTNSMWLSDRLMSLGIQTVEHATIADDQAATGATLRRLAAAAPLVIATGGLGPTADDLTRQALADLLGETLVADPDALATLEQRFAARGRIMTPIQRIQACRPPSAAMLPNSNGTAPGLLASIGAPAHDAGRPAHQRTDIFCLPGPPNEMQPMFEASVVPALRPDPSRAVETAFVHIVGIGEADGAARLGELMDRTRNPLVGITASGGVLTVRVRCVGARGQSRQDVARTVGAVRQALEPYILGEADDTLAGVVLRQLVARGQWLAVVESCTGGMLGEVITKVPGSSGAFVGGFLTYSDELKMSLVGVSEPDLARHGAVSEPVARQMAVGGLARTGADHCLAITGVAGPDGGTPAKPVGTVFIAHAARAGGSVRSGRGEGTPGVGGSGGGGGEQESAGVHVHRFLISGSRQEVRARAATAALAMLHLRLKGVPPGGSALLWEVPRQGV